MLTLNSRIIFSKMRNQLSRNNTEKTTLIITDELSLVDGHRNSSGQKAH